MSKPKCMITVDVEALAMRATDNHVDTLIYGKIDGKEYGIGRMMDIADKHCVKMTFFVDFAECELYGDEILEVGRYIVSRGHDMQVHCHYDLLERIVGKPAREGERKTYYSWYQDEEDSRKIIGYVTDKYIECTGTQPIAYRGGEYRCGIGVLKALKELGYTADLSYNYLRPDVLSPTKQFVYENGLLELPMGILPSKIPFNMNKTSLMPTSREDFDRLVSEYEALFEDFYNYYGKEAVCSFLMHSWSFLHNPQNPSPAGYFDVPNDMLVEFFDYFLSKFKDKVDFVSVTDAVGAINADKLKLVDFYAIFQKEPFFSVTNLLKVAQFIKDKVAGREIVIWGRGWIEATIFRNVNLHEILDISYYISQDAHNVPVWRGKPVHQFGEVTISPETHYVLVVAQPAFSDIRSSLQELGFVAYEDCFDIQHKVPVDSCATDESIGEYICPICGESKFAAYNSEKIRRCSTCGSLERTRTFVKLLQDNVEFDCLTTKILHISPSIPERKFFKNIGAQVATIDIRPECRVDIVADICNMPEVETASFDVVFANCVLNHVYDDEKALSELARVLKPGGMALLWVQESGTLKTVLQDDPTGWYGQENYEKYRIGTFRHYGETDFMEQLCSHFSEVQCYEKYDEVTDTSCKWYKGVK